MFEKQYRIKFKQVIYDPLIQKHYLKYFEISVILNIIFYTIQLK